MKTSFLRLILLLSLYAGPAMAGALVWAVDAWAVDARAADKDGAGLVVRTGDGHVVRVSDRTCRELVTHSPSNDVAYAPGVDVKGRAVAPADLPGGGAIDVPDEVVIGVDIQLQERFGLPENSGQYEGEAYIGVATYRDGRVFFNGQPLRDESQAKLEAACGRLVKGD
ncbi:MAG: hypothetical protein RIC93_05130 [Alphaproteobacteria bacterium]